MVLPTPFERLLQTVAQQANQDPLGAFQRLDELYGKSLTEQDVLQLAALSVHLGTTGLGRYDETIAFQHRLQKHPALTAEGEVARSIWRGLAVTLLCANRREAAMEAAAKGVNGPNDACRLAIMTAQTLLVRGRGAEAMPHLAQATKLVAELPATDEVVGNMAMIANNLMRLVEPQVRMSQDLIVAVAQANRAAWARHPEWRARHRALYQHGQALLLAARPTATLAIVQAMMEIEDQHEAGPLERFFTAALACRAQGVRGQFKIAAGALEACQDFAKRVEEGQRQQVGAALTELEQVLAQLRETPR